MSAKLMDKAVIMARGLGTRMRKEDSSAEVTAEQAAVANTGVKAMIPIDRPFLDYVLSELADAGYRRICLVIGPEHDQLREYYGRQLSYDRLEVEFAIQAEPRGTADAVLAAADFAGDDPFLVINSDNYYPQDSLRALRGLDHCGLVGYDRERMLAGSNIPAERLTRFAVVRSDEAGFMQQIIEKPSDEQVAALPEPICVSMNCWRFGGTIFEGCRNISLSARGEFELPDAVMYTISELGERYKVVPCSAPVLDLSSRDDVAAVTEKLAGNTVAL